MDELELAEWKAKEIIRLAEEKAKGIIGVAKVLAETPPNSSPLSAEMILAIQNAVQKEREWTDKAYAIKLVERILFAILALFGISTMTYFLNLYLKK